LIIKNAIATTDGPLAIADRVPDETDARHKSVVAVCNALRDTGIA
jgi:hypothetical protein